MDTEASHDIGGPRDKRDETSVTAHRRCAAVAISRCSAAVFGNEAGGPVYACEAVMDVDLLVTASSTKIRRNGGKGNIASI